MKESKIKRIGDILFEDEIVKDIGKKAKEVGTVIKDNANAETLTTALVAGEQLFNKLKNKIKG